MRLTRILVLLAAAHAATSAIAQQRNPWDDLMSPRQTIPQQQRPPQQPPPQQPPPQQPPPQQPPPNNGQGNQFAPNDPANFNQLTCRNANNVLQPFDKAGELNVGNRAGRQFITGRCTSNADCGSGACAFPCGVCSGPAVVGSQAAPINGKTGSGFFCPAGTEGRTCGQRSGDGR
jgi:hypothetical protein